MVGCSPAPPPRFFARNRPPARRASPLQDDRCAVDYAVKAAIDMNFVRTVQAHATDIHMSIVTEAGAGQETTEVIELRAEDETTARGWAEQLQEYVDST